ncbi:hypothetical protein GCM10025881_35920 [Pseudolysinimonas kribbensis]|uniref:DNA-directed DNA polymerase family A palm domain-containing protein n=1 Tax=Pseudolysinimonas kribbensis TaxID=433641 RepID=A0ABQ6KBK0_9MICO|nr:hypothetical protein GCM10025881_35920 [Pseudolysinimonas kribbensis]
MVTTWLGRSSPPGRHGPGRIDGADETLSDAETRRAQNDARGWGRFTRNFVVQGTAAEWALCWMGGLRRRLWELGGPGQPLTERPHLVFFLHDELIVHTPRRSRRSSRSPCASRQRRPDVCSSVPPRSSSPSPSRRWSATPTRNEPGETPNDTLVTLGVL